MARVEKTCTECGVKKPLDEFHRSSGNSDGHTNYCKACKRDYDRAYRAANRERIAETDRAYYEANRERIAERVRAWQENNRERKAEYNRAWYSTNRERKAETQRAWYEANRESVDEYRRVWGKANPEKVAGYYAHYRDKHPDRAAARSEVTKAVMRGDFPPASALVCDHCQEAQAEHWHHHLGYAPEHQLDVIPVCIPCHVELDRET